MPVLSHYLWQQASTTTQPLFPVPRPHSDDPASIHARQELKPKIYPNVLHHIGALIAMNT